MGVEYERTSEDKVIAVMGATGVGKSYFVQAATGDESAQVGHTLQSVTHSISAHRLQVDNHQVVLLDTPGFDDTYRNDAEILKDIADWLAITYVGGQQLTAIIYLHRISDSRMSGSTMRNLATFKKLIGVNALHNVVLVTTMWDRIDEVQGTKREEALVRTPEFWGAMMSHGSTAARFNGSREGASIIIRSLLNNTAMALKIQEEMIDDRLHLEETEAGKELLAIITKLKLQHEREILALRSEMEEALSHNDKVHAEEVAQMSENYNRELAIAQAQIHALHSRNPEIEALQTRHEQEMESLMDSLEDRMRPQKSVKGLPSHARESDEHMTVDSGYVSRASQPSAESQKDNKVIRTQFTLLEEHSLADVEELEEKDAKSQKSAEIFGEGLSSMAESLLDNNVQEIAQSLILDVLENDEVLNPLVRRSLDNFDKHRVVKNLARFMQGYCILLSNAQPTVNQKRTIRFFRRRCTNFASILCNNLDSSTLDLNEGNADDKSKALAAERKARLALWLTENSENVSSTPFLDVDNSNKSDDESWGDSEGIPPVLEDIKIFLTDGEPLKLFRQNFARFVAGESINEWNSLIKSKLQLERGREVDRRKAPIRSTSPFPTMDSLRSSEIKRDSIIELENHGGFQLSWGCRCGRKFEARIAGSDRRAAEDFLQRMDWKVERYGPMVTHCFGLQWLEDLLWVLAPGLLNRFSFEIPSKGMESEDLEAGRDSNLPKPISNSTNRGQQCFITQMDGQGAVDDADAKRDLVYVCLFNRKGNDDWRLKHAKVYRNCNIKAPETSETEDSKVTQNMDKALFLALRERLVKGLKGTGWFSPLVITGLEFWEFKLFYTAKLVKRVKKDKLPYESQPNEPESPDTSSASQVEEWEYTPLTGQRLSDYKEVLQSELLLHLLKFPDDAHPESPVWAGLPRKVRTKFINRQATPKIGWGFSVDHEWNTLAFTISMCPIIIAGFVLAIYLSIRHSWPVSAAITLALAPITLITFLNTMLKDVMKQKNLSK